MRARIRKDPQFPPIFLYTVLSVPLLPRGIFVGSEGGRGGADNVVVHRWDGFSIKMGEQRMHAHVPRRRDGGNHERKEEEEDLARIDVNEILSALPPLPVSLRLTLVVLSFLRRRGTKADHSRVGRRQKAPFRGPAKRSPAHSPPATTPE